MAQAESVEYVGALTYGGARFGLGALSLLPVILIFERRREKDPVRTRNTLVYGAVLGAILFVAVTTQQYGIEITASAGKSGFITAMYIILVPIFGLAFFRRRVSNRIWLGASAALAGLYLVNVKPGESLGSFGTGEILLVICAVFWAVHIMSVDFSVSRCYPVRLAAAQFAVCAVLSFIAAPLAGEDVTRALNPEGWGTILYGGILSAGVAYTLQIVGQKEVPPARAAVLFSMEAPFSVIGGAVLLGETMPAQGYAGCALIFAGIILSQSDVIFKREAKHG